MAKRPARIRNDMGVSSEEQGKQEASVDESVWFCLTRRFHFLATAMRKPRPLTVYESVSVEDHKFGTWVFSPPLDVLSRFEEAAIQAGKELGAPEGIDPLRFWLPHFLPPVASRQAPLYPHS